MTKPDGDDRPTKPDGSRRRFRVSLDFLVSLSLVSLSLSSLSLLTLSLSSLSIGYLAQRHLTRSPQLAPLALLLDSALLLTSRSSHSRPRRSSSKVLHSSSLSAPLRHSSSPAASPPQLAELLGARLAAAPLIAARCSGRRPYAAPQHRRATPRAVRLLASTPSPQKSSRRRALWRNVRCCCCFVFCICSFADDAVVTGPFRFALPQAFE